MAVLSEVEKIRQFTGVLISVLRDIRISSAPSLCCVKGNGKGEGLPQLAQYLIEHHPNASLPYSASLMSILGTHGGNAVRAAVMNILRSRTVIFALMDCRGSVGVVVESVVVQFE